MPSSRKELIQASLRDRIKTVTNANGYDTDVQNVYMDEIPMGLDLDEYQLPAVLVISGKDSPKHEHQCVAGKWLIELQLIHKSTVGDSEMLKFQRDIIKAIYANSPTVQRADAWRTFNGKPSGIWLQELDTDLNMIDANRFYGITLLINYHGHITDL